MDERLSAQSLLRTDHMHDARHSHQFTTFRGRGMFRGSPKSLTTNFKVLPLQTINMVVSDFPVMSTLLWAAGSDCCFWAINEKRLIGKLSFSRKLLRPCSVLECYRGLEHPIARLNFLDATY